MRIISTKEVRRAEVRTGIRHDAPPGTGEEGPGAVDKENNKRVRKGNRPPLP